MPNLPNGKLQPGSVHQLFISRGTGVVHITESEPGYWREWVFNEGFNGRGHWYTRHSLDCTVRTCDAYDVPERLREACRFALTW